MFKKALGILLSAMIVISSLTFSAVGVSAAEDGPKFIVAGSSEDIFGMVWSETDEDNLMEENSDGIYEKVFYDVSPAENVQLKVVERPADGGNSIWHGDSTGNNFTFNITADCDLTVTYDPQTETVTVSGDYIEMVTDFNLERVVAAGNGDPEADESYLNGIAWDPASVENEMTEVTPGVYEIVFENVSENMGYQIKFTDGSWTNNWGGDFAGSGVVSDADYNGANITFDVEEDNSTVIARLDLTEFDFSTKTGAKFSITIIGTQYIVAGNSEDIFGMVWNETYEDNLMTQNENGIFEKTFTDVAPAQNVQLKVVERPAGGGNSIWHGDSTGNNFTFNVTDYCDITVTYNPATEEVTVSGANITMVVDFNLERVVVAGNGDPEADANFLNGIGWDPAAEANEMTEVAPGIYEITFEGVSENMGYQLKFTDGSWTNNWGGDFVGSGLVTDADYNGANITFDVDEDDSTVVVRLDLTDFNYATKTGAKFTITINGEVDEAGYDATLKPKTYSLALASSIEMNFKVDPTTLGNYTDPYIEVTMNGEKTILKDYVVDGNYYVYSFNKIYPHLIGDELTAVVHAKNGTVDVKGVDYVRSAKGYCESQITKTAAYHDSFASLHAILVNLLNYGAATQVYAGYKTNDLCNQNVTAEQQTWAYTDLGNPPNYKDMSAVTIDNPTVSMRSASLSLGSTVGVSISFNTNEDITDMTCVATIKGTDYTYTSKDFEFVKADSGVNRYKVVCEQLFANDMKEPVAFTVYDKNGNAISNTATYSISSYVANHMNDEGALGDLLRAMYLYGEATANY